MARDGQTPLSQFGFLPLLADDAKVLKGEPLNIIQHPNGEPKQLALRANDLVDILDIFLHYQTDTAPGSSGSPVFNDQWEVVALHHSGVPKRDEQNRILACGGGIWSSEMGDQWIDWIANEGARISKLIAHISAQTLSPDADALRKELLAAAPAQPAVAEAKPEPETKTRLTETIPQLHVANGNKVEDLGASVRGPEQQPQATVSVEGGVATWTIPIQVSIRLGQPTMGNPPEPAARPAAAPADKPAGLVSTVTAHPAPVAAPTTPAQPAAAASQEVQEALKELAEAPVRPYYDAAADAADVEAYYKGIAADASPDEMFKALSQLVSSTAKKIPRYSPIKNVYPWVDLQPDLTIHSVYSDKVMNAKDLILEDAQVQDQRAARERVLHAGGCPEPGGTGPGVRRARIGAALQLRACRVPVVVPQGRADAGRHAPPVCVRIGLQQLPRQHALL